MNVQILHMCAKHFLTWGKKAVPEQKKESICFSLISIVAMQLQSDCLVTVLFNYLRLLFSQQPFMSLERAACQNHSKRRLDHFTSRLFI